jgi:hypothetical protein
MMKISNFIYRSIVFTKSTGDCILYDVDRHVLAGLPSFAPKEGSDYMERNCIESDPKRLCIYDKVFSFLTIKKYDSFTTRFVFTVLTKIKIFCKNEF